MSTLDIYRAISSIITGFLSFIYVLILTLEWRFSARTMKVLIPAFLLSLSAGSALYFILYGVSDQTKLHTAVFAIVAFIAFNLTASRYPLLQIFCTYTTSCIFTFISDTICGILVPQPGLLHVLAKVGVFLAFAVLLVYFLRRPMLEVQREVQRRNWLWMMVIPLVICFAFFYVVQMQGPLYEDPMYRPVVLVLCFCVVSVYASFYFVLRSLQKQYQIQSESAILQVQLSSLKKQADTMKSMGDQISLIQHDLRHYVHIQSMCLEHGDAEGMKEALASLSQHIRDTSDSHGMYQYTGQTLVDAVLSYYADCAKSAGIVFQVRLHLPDSIDDTSELAVMLSNAVENAYHACLGMDSCENREIHITGGMDAGRFLLEVANTYQGEVRFDGRGIPITQQAGHGYGTQSIASYAKKRHAQLYYRTDGGWFRLRFVAEL